MKLIMSDLENGQTFSRATVARSVIWVNIIQQKKIIKRSDRDLKNCFRSYFLVNLTFLNVFFPSDEYPNESFKF